MNRRGFLAVVGAALATAALRTGLARASVGVVRDYYSLDWPTVARHYEGGVVRVRSVPADFVVTLGPLVYAEWPA